MPARVRLILPGLFMMPLMASSGLCADQADRPLFLPTDDVAVIYRFDGVAPNLPRKLQITYTAKGARVRIDYFRFFEAKYPYFALIFDRPADRLISVHHESKSYYDRPIGANSNPGSLLSPDKMDFTRQGPSMVAHAPCTDWQIVVRDKQDGKGTACVTDDGVVLRLAATMPTVTTLTATTIHYGPPPDGIFAPPAGFKREPEPDLEP
jgi:hypothetical protein